MTLPPIFGIEEREKQTLEPRKHHFSGKKPDFWPPEGLFQLRGRSQSGFGCRGRKWGHLGEKIDLQTFGPEMGFEGRGS